MFLKKVVEDGKLELRQCSNDCLIVKLLSMLSKKQSWAPLSSFALLRPRVNDAKAKV